ncbi:hypothetical protein [Methylocella sp.]|jgi:hypothetical protein|uniref:hypothetical protein n=1 Tax=Methylocella sp. TaxID=1978226 RepID=UPI003C1B9BEA
MKLVSVAIAATLLTFASAQAETNIAGKYSRAKPSRSDLVITPDGDQWKITLDGAGDPMPAGTAAADCHMEAKGSLKNGVLLAKVIPFTGDENSVEAGDLQTGEHVFIVKFDGSGAHVTKEDVSFCGEGSDLLGLYKKQP